MIIHRLRNRLPRISFQAIDEALTQLYFYRAMCGGIYVRMDNRWYGAVPIMTLSDGTHILRRCDESAGSFHETFMGIQQLEDHT